MDRDPVRIF